MKIRHKTHGWTPDRTDPEWAERVQREADQQTNRRDVAYEKAKRRLVRARERAEREAAKASPDKPRLKKLWATVDRRRQELLALERVVQASPAGSQHRGRRSHRHVSTSDTRF